VVIELDPSDGDRVVELFERDFYIDASAIAAAAARRSMVNVIHRDLLVKVYLIIRKDTPYRLAEFRRRRSVRIDAVSISIVAAEDPVLSNWSG